MSLLAAVAEEQPLLCVIDDAHWLDEASAAAMTFVARRLDADGIAVLFGAGSAIRAFTASGIPELRLGGLDRAAARQLLAAHLPAGAGSLVAEQLIEISLGNPLALLRASRRPHRAAARRAGPFDEPPLAGRAVEHGFLRRLAQLPSSTRRAVLVVAASDVGELRVLSRALAVLGLDSESLEPAERAGLITLAPRVDFCHPRALCDLRGRWADRPRRSAQRAGSRSRRRRQGGSTSMAPRRSSSLPDEQIASASWALPNLPGAEVAFGRKRRRLSAPRG